MKTNIRRAIIVAAFSALAINTASAGDPTPRWLAELRRQREAEENERNTVAVYANGGLGQRVIRQEQPTEKRFKLRTNAHGQTTGLFVNEQK